MAIKDLEYSAIFHEQGLGKTKIAIDLLLYWLTKRDIDTVIIVTKVQVANPGNKLPACSSAAKSSNWLLQFSLSLHAPLSQYLSHLH